MIRTGMISAIAIGAGMGIGHADFIQSSPMAPHGGAGNSAHEMIENRFHWSNMSLLRTIREIKRRQPNMRFTSGEDTQRFIDEARAGAMYGFDVTE